MLVHPVVAEAEPLIVAGTPRSGTRFVTNAYNAHPDVHLIGELLAPATRATIASLKKMDRAYNALPGDERRRAFAAEWESHRARLLYAMWSSITKQRVRPPDRAVRWFGYKTPYHEEFWRSYQELLSPLHPKWVICLRGFVDHYLSAEAQAPIGIRKRARLYRRTIDTYADMKAELGDSVSLFILEDLIEHGHEYVRTVLFESLGIPVTREVLDTIDPGSPANDSKRAGRVKRELTKAEHAFLKHNPDLAYGLDRAREARPASSTAARSVRRIREPLGRVSQYAARRARKRVALK